ncbi:signal-transducing adaptor protein 1 isoform X2 [Struthio camelus]|uniref:signal-transducing adaptor protein 1 isoform X2 n=1 Tax=Struthio camelus TaxID=8801 RepID=UPI0036040978
MQGRQEQERGKKTSDIQRSLGSIMEEPEKIPKPAPRRIFHERQRVTGLPLYFESYLSIRHSRCQYSQKLDISTLISVTNIYLDENGFAQFILRLPTVELELKVEDCELGKEWKGFILTVTKMSVPPEESLLPGQFMRMHEVLEKEKKRKIMLNDSSSASLNEESPPSSNYSSTLTTMPACFYAVSRQKAVEMLEKNPSWGNLILRPGSDSKNYAITVRQVLHVPFIKHYRVMTKAANYVIVLEREVTLMSLHDVISYFVTHTQGNLRPFVMPTNDNMLQGAQHSEGVPTSKQMPVQTEEKTTCCPGERPLLASFPNQIVPLRQECCAPASRASRATKEFHRRETKKRTRKRQEGLEKA